MDLIYMDSSLNDIGVLDGYLLDMAYGKDENDFVLEMPLDSPKMQTDNFIYIEKTEYGGIIDSIGADTSEGKLIYKGRTWTGILASKIIEPLFRFVTESGAVYDSYRTFYGEANKILGAIIGIIGLNNTFDVSTENSGIVIKSFQFRFDDAYSGIFRMLSEYNAKLSIYCDGGRPMISAVIAMNYATANDFDSSIVKFKIESNKNRVNHLICLGSGELYNRHIIHLFADYNGGLQSYLKVDGRTPMQDSDYYLGTDRKVLYGIHELTEVYDYPNAETVENYLPLSTEPQDWGSGYWNYYEKSGDEYKQIEQRIKDVYELTTSQPSNWGSTYKNYYTRRQSGGEWIYDEVEGEEQISYDIVYSPPRYWDDVYGNYFWKINDEFVPVTKQEKIVRVNSKPINWENQYNDYYTTDGVNYNSVNGISMTRYNIQTVKPSDWKQNWATKYYVKSPAAKGAATYLHVGQYSQYVYRKKAPKWEKNKFYTQESYQVAPDFYSLGAVYEKTAGAPDFNLMTVYQEVVTYGKQWQRDTFFKKIENTDIGMEFLPDVYYKKVYDHYAELVKGGIERLKELNNSDVLDITLDETEKEYNIGDIIGATEQTTKTTTSQMIVKKIVKIERGVLTVRHEVS